MKTEQLIEEMSKEELIQFTKLNDKVQTVERKQTTTIEKLRKGILDFIYSLTKSKVSPEIIFEVTGNKQSLNVYAYKRDKVDRFLDLSIYMKEDWGHEGETFFVRYGGVEISSGSGRIQKDDDRFEARYALTILYSALFEEFIKNGKDIPIFKEYYEVYTAVSDEVYNESKPLNDLKTLVETRITDERKNIIKGMIVDLNVIEVSAVTGRHNRKILRHYKIEKTSKTTSHVVIYENGQFEDRKMRFNNDELISDILNNSVDYETNVFSLPRVVPETAIEEKRLEVMQVKEV